MTRCLRFATAALLPALIAGCGGGEAAPTFTRDVAPILFEQCADCHRPGEAAPFSLLTYDDAKRRSRQIAEVTTAGFMPPWLPAAGEHPLSGARRLSPEAVELLERWHQAGAPRGDLQALPETPVWTAGWQLGEPDLVVELEESFTVPADGIDVIRNFVMPVRVDRPRWVRAVELRPGNRRTVHHGILRIDKTPSSRLADASDPQPGFGGMEMGQAVSPGGQFVGWTPGKLPFPGVEGMAWLLTDDTDLVLQLHLLPSGKAETVRPRIGLYFTDEPPTIQPTEITLYVAEIDIPAGADDYSVEDRFLLPVPVELIGIYPHAHYLGKEVRVTAQLPQGVTTTLLDIPHWDFNWQDDYRYVSPVPLPAGTTIELRVTYDNSAGNPRNPNDPPQRVQRGLRSVDEMASLGLQVLTEDDRQRARLDEAIARAWLDRSPAGWNYINNLGIALAAQGRIDEAVKQYLRALELNPSLVEARYNLGLARLMQGRVAEAVGHLEQTLRLRPEHARAHNNLGHVALAAGRSGAAVDHFRRAVEAAPYLREAHYNLGIALGSLRRYDEAAAHYEEAIALDPSRAMAHNNLGTVLHLQGKLVEAMRAYEKALELDPELALAARNLGQALLDQGRPGEAIGHFERALELDATDAIARDGLDRARRLR